MADGISFSGELYKLLAAGRAVRKYYQASGISSLIGHAASLFIDYLPWRISAFLPVLFDAPAEKSSKTTLD
jgi:hypothetical protein